MNLRIALKLTLFSVAASFAAVSTDAAGTCPTDYQPGPCDVINKDGALVFKDTCQKAVYWIFSADSMFEGGQHALDVLAEKGVKASFFFTGNFLRNSAWRPTIERVIADGHYVGGHSDGHILLADWDAAKTILVDADSCVKDAKANLRELAKFGITPRMARYLLPPYEWTTPMHTAAYNSIGLTVINNSPGLIIFTDFTTPDMKAYRTSQEIIDQFMERLDTHGLNGAFIIMHLGTEDARTDKLYRHLGMLIDTLNARGYRQLRL